MNQCSKKHRLRKIIAYLLAFSMIFSFEMNTGKALITSKAAVPDANQKVLTYQDFVNSNGNGITMSSGYMYIVNSNINYTADTGKAALSVNGTCYLYIAAGCTVTLTGGNGYGQNIPGAPGVSLPSGSTLVVTGEGMLVANGGNAGDGCNGYNGTTGVFHGKKANHETTGTGGAGGAGGAGAGAGIGGFGGLGGAGGAGGAGQYRQTDPGPFPCVGISGAAGKAGTAGSDMGTLYVLGTVAISANGGSIGKGGAAGYAGGGVRDAGSGFKSDYYGGAGGGGGGGASGCAATDIGGGASGGGGGGGGAGGGGCVNHCYPHGRGGSPGTGGATGIAGYYLDAWHNIGYGGAGGSATSAGNAGTVYRSKNANCRRCDYVAETHSGLQYSLIISSNAQKKSESDVITDVEPVTYTFGASKITADNAVSVPTRTGYTLDGLYNQETGGTKYISNKGIIDVDLFKRENIIDSSNYWYSLKSLDLYAHWTPKQYSLNLNANGGSGGCQVSATYDEAMPAINVPSKPGYKFDGYYIDSACKGKQYIDKNGAWQCNADGTDITDIARWYGLASNLTLYAKWVPIEYAINLYSDGQFITCDDPDYVGVVDPKTKKGSGISYGTFTLPSAEEVGLSKKHYEFLGWNIYDEQNWAMYKAGTVYRGGLTDKEGEVVNVYAAWEILDSYSISYNGNGGNKIPGAEYAFEGDEYEISDIIPKREGYSFVGWSENSEDSIDSPDLIQPKDKITVTESKVLYAIWKENPIVSYNSNGGTFDENIDKKGYAFGETVNVCFDENKCPYRNGYTFDGWYRLGQNGEKIEYKKGETESFEMPIENVVLYANWDADEYTVNYRLDSENFYCLKDEGDNTFYGIKDASGVETGTTIQSAEYDSTYIFKLVISKYLDNSGLAVYVNDSKYRNPEPLVDGDNFVYIYNTGKVNGETKINISGVNEIYHSIVYHNNGGKFDPEKGDAPNEFLYGAGVELPDAAMILKTGYTFDGWYTDADFTEAILSIDKDTNADVDVYAKWTPINYNIKFALNGGSGDIGEVLVNADAKALDANNEIEVTYADQITLPDSTNIEGPFTIDGGSKHYFNFLGWSTDPDSQTAEYPGDFDISALTSKMDEKITLFAVWDTPACQVSFDAGGGSFSDGKFALTESTFVTRTVDIDEIEEPTRKGYTFEGWKLANQIVTGEYTLAGDIVFTASWKAIDYTITFDYNVPAQGTYDVYKNSYDDLDKIDVSDASAKVTQTIAYDESKELLPNVYKMLGREADSKVKVKKFVGWATNPASSVPNYIDEQTVTNVCDDDNNYEITLYAVWTDEAVEYLNYDANQGAWTNKPVPVKVQYNYECEIEVGKDDDGADVIPTKTGYVFDGWSTSPTDDTATYQSGDRISSGLITGSKGLTLYAVWKPITYSIRYDLDNNSAAYTTAYTPDDGHANWYTIDGISYDEAIALLDYDCAKCAKKHITGWQIDDVTYQGGYVLKNLTALADDVIEIKAIWADNHSITVNYDVDEYAYIDTAGEKHGEVTYNGPKTATFYADEESDELINAELTNVKPTAEGFTFMGWTTNKQSLDLVTSIEASSNVTLYPIWSENTYRLNLYKYAEDATENQLLADISSRYTEKFVYTDSNDKYIKFSLGGHEFDTSNVCSFEEISEYYSMPENEDDIINVYNCTEEESEDYYVSISLNGGTFKKDVSCPLMYTKTFPDMDSILESVEREGYIIDSYTTNVSKTYATDEDLESNVEIKLEWKEKDYSIKYSLSDGQSFVNKESIQSGLRADTSVKLYGSSDVSYPEHKLVGWKNAENEVYNPGANVKINVSNDGDMVTMTPVFEDDATYTTCKVSFDANGGKNAPAPINVSFKVSEEGTTFDVSTYSSERVGYTFAGWSIEKNQAPVTGPITVSADVTLYAVWTPITYTVSYDKVKTDASFANGKTETVIFTYDETGSLYKAVDVTCPNYELVGWEYTSTGDGLSFVPGQSVINLASENITVSLKAVWEKKADVYVSFDANLGKWSKEPDVLSFAEDDYESVNIEPLSDGEAVSLARKGYTLLGWSKSKTATEPEFELAQTGFDSKVTGNMTLFAVWKANTYTIKYMSEDVEAVFSDSLNTETATVEEEDYQYVVTSNTFDVSGNLLTSDDVKLPNYKLSGWSLSSKGEVDYQPGQEIKNLATGETDDEEVVLYPVWKKLGSWTIHYNSNGGEGAPEAFAYMKDEEGNATGSVTAETPKRDGYSFVGWSTDKQATEADEKYAVGEQVILSSDLTLYAVWERLVTYSVTYKANGGVGRVPNDLKEYKENEKVTVLFDNIPTKTGYTFAGWAKALDATEPDYVDEAPADETLSPDANYTFNIEEDVTLYAVWIENNYTVSFFDGKNQLDDITVSDDNKLCYTETFEVPNCDLTAPVGNTFAGWSITEGGNAMYHPGEEISSLSGNDGDFVALYVCWEKITATVSLIDEKNATTEDSFEVLYGNELPDLHIANVAGYNFEGYFDDDNMIYNNKGVATNKSSFVKNIELKAKWSPVVYHIMYEQDGNVISNQAVSYDEEFSLKKAESITGLSIPIGYRLNGWSLLPAGASSLDTMEPGKTITNNELYKNGSDITLYPVIVLDTVYTINYNGNGGSNVPVDLKNYKYGDVAQINLTNIPVREGYTFLGWGTSPVDMTVDYSNDKDSNTLIVTKNVTLYAVWESNGYQLEYHSDHSSDTIRDDLSYNSDGYTFRTQNELETYDQAGNVDVDLNRKGYTLLGWSTSKLGSSVSYDPGSEMYSPLTRKKGTVINLYSVWKPITYTIVFNSNKPVASENSVIGNMVNQEVIYDKAEKLLVNEFELEGYTFLGWSTNKDDTVAMYSNQEEIKNLCEEDKKTVVLYAIWSLDSYTFTFDNQSHGRKIEPVTVLYGDDVKMEDESDDDYQFDGWFGDDTFTTLYKFENPIKHDVTVYAKWTKYVASVKKSDGTIEKFTEFEKAIDFAKTNPNATEVEILENTVLKNDMEIPDNVTLDLGSNNVSVPSGNTFVIKGQVIGDKDSEITGEGTLRNEGNISGTTLSIPKVDNTKGEINNTTITNTTVVEGGKMKDVKNAGTIISATLSGNTKNTGTIDKSTIKGNLTNKAVVINSNTSSAVVKGNSGLQSVDKAQKSILTANTDKGDVAGSVYRVLKLRGTSKKKAVKLGWNPVKNASGYMVYSGPCFKKLKLVKDVKNGVSTGMTVNNLKAGKYYKFVVMAYKIVGTDKQVISTSKTIHVATLGKYGNPSKIKVTSKKKLTLKVKKTSKIKAKVTSKKKMKKHASLRYESSNTKVATVSKKGKIKAVGKGSATIYVFAQNGISIKIKVKCK